MNIDISIPHNSQEANLKLTSPNGESTIKKVLLHTLIEKLTSIVPPEEDTGYLCPHLIRRISQGTLVSRYYSYPQYTTTVRCVLGSSDLTVKENPYNISKEIMGDYSYLVFPEFVFRNVVGFTINNNNESHNCVAYRVALAKPNILGEIDDKSVISTMLPNHFSNHICWPRDFDSASLLRNKNESVQHSFISQYLSSRFNNDLLQEISNPNMSTELREEFTTFLNSIFNQTTGRRVLDQEWNSRVFPRLLWYYFISNVKNENPLNYLNLNQDVKSLVQSITPRQNQGD